MIIKCCFCEYSKINVLPQDAFKALVSLEKDAHMEDYMTFGMKIAEGTTGNGWNSVKVHMGMMHKGEAYYGIWPRCEWEPHEKELIEKQS